MINIQQFYKFCNEQNLSAEEASLILAIDQNNSGGEFKLAFSQYMSRESKRFKYKILVPTLIERGFLRNLGDKDKLKLSELRVTDKFRSLLLVDIDEAYNQARELYPKKMSYRDSVKGITNQGPSFGNREEDKEAYSKFVLGGSSKANHARFLYIMTAIQNDHTVFPDGMAKMKWATFCRNFDGFAEVFESTSASVRSRRFN